MDFPTEGREDFRAAAGQISLDLHFNPTSLCTNSARLNVKREIGKCLPHFLVVALFQMILTMI